MKHWIRTPNNSSTIIKYSLIQEDRILGISFTSPKTVNIFEKCDEYFGIEVSPSEGIEIFREAIQLIKQHTLRNQSEVKHLLPRVEIVGVTHYKAPDDPILGRSTLCGIDKTVDDRPTAHAATCRTCKVLANYVNNHIVGDT